VSASIVQSDSSDVPRIINPGKISGHVHAVVGGSQFDTVMDYNKTQQAQCTTAGVTLDLSSYWTPPLYHHDPILGYQLIPLQNVNTYYLFRGDDGGVGGVTAPPKGLKMFVGNPARRTFDPTSVADQAISFVCLTNGEDHSGDPSYDQRNSFFDHQCDGGMRMQVNVS
jgi:hypothetical protein